MNYLAYISLAIYFIVMLAIGLFAYKNPPAMCPAIFLAAVR